MLIALLIPTALAKSGSYGPTLSTWDARSSSVALQGRQVLEEGTTQLSYSTNFSSSKGRLSSQFALTGARSLQTGGQPGLLGFGASAITLYQAPIRLGRHDNGVPKLALAVYWGPSPMVLLGRQDQRDLQAGAVGYSTVPWITGLGVPVSPLDWLTIAPWGEAAAGVDLDIDVKDLTGEPDGETLESPIVYDAGFNLGWRAGLTLEFLVPGDRLGVRLDGSAGSLGAPDDIVFGASGALVFHWDDVVPAVLPPAEACELPELPEGPEEPVVPEEPEVLEEPAPSMGA